MSNKNRNRRPKGKGKYEKRGGMDKEVQKDMAGEERQSQARNDVSWYSRNPELLLAAGSTPFPYRPGMQVPWMYVRNGETQHVSSIPGIMAINWGPTIGYSQNATDPASVIGKEIYAKVRAKYSGRLYADAPDFVIYIMALDSIFSYIAWLKRIYRISGMYTPENHYMPDALLTACGLNATAVEDIYKNRMKLWQVINELVLMSRKFHVPAVFDVMRRHYWLNDNVFLDASSPNAQLYLFNEVSGYYFQMLNNPQGELSGGLSVQQWYVGQNNINVDALFTLGRTMINALAGSEDAYTISGYLLRAYEGQPEFIVDEIPIDDKLTLSYEPEVLMQIENAASIPFKNGSGILTLANLISQVSNAVTQDPLTNSVLCKPMRNFTYTSSQFVARHAGLTGFNPVLSIRSDSPTVADVTIATRLKNHYNNFAYTDQSKNQAAYEIVCGSEIVYSMTIYTYMQDGMSSSLKSYDIDSTDWFLATDMMKESLIQSFDWHPIRQLIATSVPTSEGVVSSYTGYIVGDVHNLTAMDIPNLQQLNRICLYSEFDSYGQI